MSTGKTKTNNAFPGEKAYFRLKYTPDHARVLDLCHGEGLMWAAVKLRKPELVVHGIDKKNYSKGFSLIGDNIKTVGGLSSLAYDVIDCDVYGDPTPLIEACLCKITGRTLFFFTFIQSVVGKLSHSLLAHSGLNPEMINQAPALCSSLGFDAFRNFLSDIGAEEFTYIRKGRKYYGKFYCQPGSAKSS